MNSSSHPLSHSYKFSIDAGAPDSEYPMFPDMEASQTGAISRLFIDKLRIIGGVLLTQHRSKEIECQNVPWYLKDLFKSSCLDYDGERVGWCRGRRVGLTISFLTL